jgi:hypothetical protein
LQTHNFYAKNCKFFKNNEPSYFFIQTLVVDLYEAKWIESIDTVKLMGKFEANIYNNGVSFDTVTIYIQIIFNQKSNKILSSNAFFVGKESTEFGNWVVTSRVIAGVVELKLGLEYLNKNDLKIYNRLAISTFNVDKRKQKILLKMPPIGARIRFLDALTHCKLKVGEALIN